MPSLVSLYFLLLNLASLVFGYPAFTRQSAWHPHASPRAGTSFRSPQLDLTDQRPAITGQASPQLFDYASSVAVRVLTEQFPQARLPAVKTTFHVPVLGTFHLRVDQLQLGQLSLNPARTGISLSRDASHLVLSATKVTTSATCHFHLVRHPFSSSGHAEITVTHGHLNLEMEIANDGSGRPLLVVSQPPNVGFEGLKIKVWGSKLAPLYNFVADIAQGPIRSKAVQELQYAAATSLPDAVNNAFSTLPLLVDTHGFELNVSMAGSPQGDTAGRIIFKDWGIFQNPGGEPRQCPVQMQTPSVPSPAPSKKRENQRPVVNSFAHIPHRLLPEQAASPARPSSIKAHLKQSVRTAAAFLRSDLRRPEQASGPGHPGSSPQETAASRGHDELEKVHISISEKAASPGNGISDEALQLTGIDLSPLLSHVLGGSEARSNGASENSSSHHATPIPALSARSPPLNRTQPTQRGRTQMTHSQADSKDMRHHLTRLSSLSGPITDSNEHAHSGSHGNGNLTSAADPMLQFAASESLLNCFSWAAQTQGLLNQTLQGSDILGQFAKTDAWWAVVPQLASKYPGQNLSLHLWDPQLPHTSIHAHRGIITSGTGRVSFHLASQPNDSMPPMAEPRATRLQPPVKQSHAEGPHAQLSEPRSQPSETQTERSDDVQLDSAGAHLEDAHFEPGDGFKLELPSQEQIERAQRAYEEALLDVQQILKRRSIREGQAGAARRQPEEVTLHSGQPEGGVNPLGKELFALEVGAAVTVTKLELNPDDSMCPGGLRLDAAVQVDHSSLSLKVVDSHIGYIGPLGLQLGLQLAAAAIEAQMNFVILKDGFPLPCDPHFRPANTSLHLETGHLVLQTDVEYYH